VWLGGSFSHRRCKERFDTESLQTDNSPYYLFVWEKEWEQFTDKDGLSLVEASENPDPMGKGRLFLVSVSKARPNQGEIRRDGVR